MVDLGDDTPERGPRPGSLIGERYCVIQRLGVGGMGAVYEAVNTWTSRRVAIKVLLPGVAGSPDMVRRFKLEAKVSSLLHHPNVIDVLDMGRCAVNDCLYIVEEFLEGEDLYAHLVRAGRLSPREAFDLVVPVVGALCFAHDLGIVHRDIKPENIFLKREGCGRLVPRLIDFGIAKMPVTGAGRRRTVTGEVIGTPSYMAPEQARGDSNIDGRIDVWSLGVLLFELMSGQLPIDAPNSSMMVVKLFSEPIPSLRSVAPYVPADVVAVIDRALTVDPDGRYTTMRDFLEAILACASLEEEGRPSLAVTHAMSLPVDARGIDAKAAQARIEEGNLRKKVPSVILVAEPIEVDGDDPFGECLTLRPPPSVSARPAAVPRSIVPARPPGAVAAPAVLPAARSRETSRVRNWASWSLAAAGAIALTTGIAVGSATLARSSDQRVTSGALSATAGARPPPAEATPAEPAPPREINALAARAAPAATSAPEATGDEVERDPPSPPSAPRSAAGREPVGQRPSADAAGRVLRRRTAPAADAPPAAGSHLAPMTEPEAE